MNSNFSDPSGNEPGGPADRIEFSCSACGKKLRVSGDIVGRQAQCPACGHTQTILLPDAMSPLTETTLPSLEPQSIDAGQVGGAIGAGDDWSAAHSALNGDRVHASTFGTADSGVETGSPPVGVDASPVAPAGPGPAASAEVGLSGSQLNVSHPGAETATKRLFDRITAEIGKIFVGQDELVLGTLVALFSKGHVLIESVPGLGKTLFVRTMGRVLGCDFGRIQFTADLMPSDITGAPIFNIKTQEFHFRPGPVFTQLLLADEINRSPAKTHAAMLEIMQEYRVTVDGTSHELKPPFFVLATQNPIESEGTYNLPEAQLDRFMFKLVAGYPSEAEEASILDLHSRQIDINRRLQDELETVCSTGDILRISEETSHVRVDPKLVQYINEIVRLTRDWPYFHMGASPRAGIALMQGSRTLASFFGRDYAVPDDVVEIVLPALRHRVILTAEAEVEGHKVDDLLTDLIRTIEVPRI